MKHGLMGSPPNTSHATAADSSTVRRIHNPVAEELRPFLHTVASGTGHATTLGTAAAPTAGTSFDALETAEEGAAATAGFEPFPLAFDAILMKVCDLTMHALAK